MTQRWLFRVASHRNSGGGHVARSGVLARALVDAGADVVLQLDPDSPDGEARIRALGLTCIDANQPLQGPWSGSVLDGYAVVANEAESFARVAPTLVVIDDFLEPPVCASLVVNGAVHLDGDRVGTIPALLGPRYALVDPRFVALRGGGKAQNPGAPVNSILVTFGRLDPDDMTSRVLSALERAGGAARLTVVASSAWPQFPALADFARALGERIRLATDIADMAPLLEAADFVVGAGGVSLMERLAAGRPSVTFSIADNQRLFVEGASRLGCTVDGGRAYGETSTVENLAALLGAVLDDGPARAAMASAAKTLIDGQGAARVARELIGLAEKRSMRRQATG